MMTSGVAVVIPCRNEQATLRRCISSIRTQDPPPDLIVVVDNGSTDGSLQDARAAADLVLEIHGGTIARLRNLGARATGATPFIAFVDADCEVKPGWLAAGLAALEHAELVGARVGAPADASWVARRWASVEARLAHAGSALWSQNLLIGRDTFARVGGFTESLATGEDVDLSRKVRDGGGQVALVAEMEVTHHGFAPDLGRFVRRERWHASTPGWWAAVSPRGRMLVAAATGWAALGGGALVMGLRRRSGAPLAAWAGAGAACTGALGAALGSGPHALQDGTLMALWALARVSRLRRGLAAP